MLHWNTVDNSYIINNKFKTYVYKYYHTQLIRIQMYQGFFILKLAIIIIVLNNTYTLIKIICINKTKITLFG
jgi:hypothetical protein